MLGDMISGFLRPRQGAAAESDSSRKRRRYEPAPDHRALYYTGLADRCIEKGDPRKALQQFGRAIDEYLETAHYNAAIDLCRRVIRLAPQAVRTRGTLAFLLLGQECPSAEAELAAYVDAAREADTTDFAIQMLHMMGTATEDQQIRQLIHHHLLELGDIDSATEVLVDASSRPGAAPGENTRERWLKLLRNRITGSRRGRLLSREAPTARYSGIVELPHPASRA